jgi:hypothetical protein
MVRVTFVQSVESLALAMVIPLLLSGQRENQEKGSILKSERRQSVINSIVARWIDQHN